MPDGRALAPASGPDEMHLAEPQLELAETPGFYLSMVKRPNKTAPAEYRAASILDSMHHDGFSIGCALGAWRFF
jgi:hypothetical protein